METGTAPTQADALVAQAWHHFEQGRLDEAVQAASQACALAPTNAHAHSTLGWFLLESQRDDDAQAVLQHALDLFPESAVAQWYLGLLRRKQGRLDEARTLLAAAVQQDPALDEAALALAWVLHDLGRVDEAVSWSRWALARKPDADRLALLGWLLLLKRDDVEASALLQSVLHIQPDRVTARCQLATALQHLQRSQEAVAVLKEGLERTPEQPELSLSLGWLHLARGETGPAHELAARLVRDHADLASGWHLLGILWHENHQPDQALSCLNEALRQDPFLVDALRRRAMVLHHIGQDVRALADLHEVVRLVPQDIPAKMFRAELLIRTHALDEARRELAGLWRQAADKGPLWHLLFQAMHRKGRRSAASAMLARARRLAAGDPMVWRHSAWMALEEGNLALARVAIDQVRALAPGQAQDLVQAACVLAACDDLVKASISAEQAVAALPQDAGALRALAMVRQRQHRPGLAQALLQSALALEPASADTLRQLGWVHLASHRWDEATHAFERATACDPQNAAIWLECAEARWQAKQVSQALEALQRALDLRPRWPQALILKARILGDQEAAHAAEAVAVCAMLVRMNTRVDEVAVLLMRLAAHGQAQAGPVLDMVDRTVRAQAWRVALFQAQGEWGHRAFCQLAALARQDREDDPALATAALYACGLDPLHPVADKTRALRQWARDLALRAGYNPLSGRRLQEGDRPLHVAYVASHFHGPLLRRVLAAHDPRRVQVFLYTDAPAGQWAGCGPHVVVQPLQDLDLAASMAANGIDVAVDTVGVHPFMGQQAVLQAFAGRLAPVQCAWLGNWAGSGGVFDALITDVDALPPDQEALYEEHIVRLPGGQWCWEPPAVSPEPGVPPCLAHRYVTFGCAVRGLRLTPDTLQAWVLLLQRVPGARLQLMGARHQDGVWRRSFAGRMAAAGVDPARVTYLPGTRYESYLDFYNTIDIALDAFPANGGLCLVDALWMGVPFVTCAGQLLGARQGASILAAVGHPEWVARDGADYVDKAAMLAGQKGLLKQLRRQLRTTLQRSPLLDGPRAARALEQAYARLCVAARPVAQAPTPKERARALAQWQFATWCDKQVALAFPCLADADPPDVSVVVVLFNQVGLARQALGALADQRGVKMEVIVIDNASSDATPELLARLQGARIRRNRRNLGFLRAANQGAAMARGRHILFLNSDAVLHADAVRHALACLDRGADVGAVGGRIVLGDGTLQEAGCIVYADGSAQGHGRGADPFSPAFAFQRDVDFCSGVFLMVRTDLWRQLGGFDAVFAPAYYEETDLCLRIWQAGWRVVYQPLSWVSHFEWASARSNAEVVSLMVSHQQRLQARHAQALRSRPVPSRANPMRDRWLAGRQHRTVLVMDNQVPCVMRGGGLPRMRSMLQALEGFAVTFYPLWHVDEDWREVYAALPPGVEVMLDQGAGQLERFLQARPGVFDVMLVSRPDNMAFVAALRHRRPALFDGVRMVYDAEAVFALRDIGRAAIEARALTALDADRRLGQELALATSAQTVLAVSSREARHFREAGCADVRVLCHSVPTRAQVPAWDQRQGFLFVGAVWPDTPNEDGLLWFATQVLPLLRQQMPELPPVDLVGECRSERVAALPGTALRLRGPLTDLLPCYDAARVFIAPCRYAAGVPLKVIEAACHGLPVVASDILVQQLGWQPGSDLLGAVDAAEFAQAMVRLYRDEALWTAVQRQALNRAGEDFAPERFAQVLRDALS